MNMSKLESGLFEQRLEYYLALDNFQGHEVHLARFFWELDDAGYNNWANQLMNRIFYPGRD